MVPSGPTTGCEPWSCSHAFGLSGVPLSKVQKVPEAPLMMTARDHVAPPSFDWLKTIGLRPPTGVALVSRRVIGPVAETPRAGRKITGLFDCATRQSMADPETFSLLLSRGEAAASAIGAP